MLKKILITGLVLLLTGACALSLLAIREHNWSKTQAEFKSKYSSDSSDYLNKYRLWLEVPEYQRTEFPWDIDSNMAMGSIDEIKQHQYERFLAEADSLNNMDHDMYPVARLLYGDDWQQKLKKYNNRRDFVKAGFVFAVISTCIGCVMVLVSAFILLGKYFLSKKPRHQQEDIVEVPEETQAQQQPPQEEDAEKQTIHSILNCHSYSTEDSDDCPKEPQGSENQKDMSLSKSRLVEMLRRRKEREVSLNKRESPDKKKTADVNASGEVIHETLNKLTEEVAAMRRYAGRQQETFKSLHQVHDWNIIRNFAMRVIRCVDNLETRIADLSQNDPIRSHLDEIKDELVFALESSGIEQYTPEINSYYKGQEKFAEPVKEKLHTDDKNCKGKISDVLKHGYRYIIDDDNFKVVRTAQVKLFG